MSYKRTITNKYKKKLYIYHDQLCDAVKANSGVQKSRRAFIKRCMDF